MLYILTHYFFLENDKEIKESARCLSFNGLVILQNDDDVKQYKSEWVYSLFDFG